MALTRAARKACLRRLKPHNAPTLWCIPSSSPIRMPTTTWQAVILAVTAVATPVVGIPEAAIPVEAIPVADDTRAAVVIRGVVAAIPEEAVTPAVVAEVVETAARTVMPMAKR